MQSNERTAGRTLRVAAVQMIAEPDHPDANRRRAEALVERAARGGAQLVVLPELFAPGYRVDRAIWRMAEPERRGPTVAWLRRTAQRLGIHLGGGLVETDGRDFFNTFIVATPAGSVAGRARKGNAEPYVFARGRGAHIVDTALGRLGIAICADNQFASMPAFFHEHNADLVLMPHAWPVPRVARGVVTQVDLREQLEHMRSLPALYATLLGVPAVFANLTGPFLAIPGVLGALLDPTIFSLGGQSRVVDSDGAVRGSIDIEEGIAVGDVVLDPSRKHLGPVPNHGGWLLEGSTISRKILVPLDIALGRVSYAFSRERARIARDVAGSG
jgi:N-carbamoylputrescine amidase